MTLTYQLDLDILLLDIHAKIQVCMSVHAFNRENETHKQTNGVKTITPVTSETWEVILVYTYLSEFYKIHRIGDKKNKFSLVRNQNQNHPVYPCKNHLNKNSYITNPIEHLLSAGLSSVQQVQGGVTQLAR